VDSPLVSVIIPCYNHGRFLQQAIDSVVRQTYIPIEVIVVDDGSTDTTKTVALRNTQVRYVYQSNQGLSAARNTGISHSTGDYLVFLDADDLLYSHAIAYNVKMLLNHPEVAFVSGGHNKVDIDLNILKTTKRIVLTNHYQNFLQINYIGMHATVMYRRSIFDTIRFDVTLRACEDYDLYLTIAAKYPVLHHTEVLTAYRQHQTNMSSDSLMMLSIALQVLQRQEKAIHDPEDLEAYQEGIKNWYTNYCEQMYHQLLDRNVSLSALTRKNYEQVLYEHKPRWFFRYQLIAKLMFIKPIAKRVVPNFLFRWAYRAGLFQSYRPKVGSVRLGDIKRLKPISDSFGYDRGGPVDRYYIENFLQQQVDLIRGRVLEIGDNEYTMRFGGVNVSQSDILHVHADAPQATIIGDLTDLPQVDTNTFDCIILTQTLHLIYDFRSAIQTCHRILKPGGMLLLTSPGISPIDHGEWQKTWYWSFNELSLERILTEYFPADRVTLQTFGNVFVATAFLYGMGQSELTQNQLDMQDSHYPVIITAKVYKPL
jgi:glycosyltransferase involved in cell wall biosynthesis